MLSHDAANRTRRRLLGLASAGALISWQASRLLPGSCSLAEHRAALLRSLVAHPARARQLGALYLDHAAAEADSQRLWSMLFGTADPRDARDCRRILAERIAQDFRNLDVLRLGGWVLARSEARLFALIWCG
jgi:hypothetical protein